MIVGPALLFCPADRPDRYARAATTADTVILDLEDGVAPADRPAARRALIDTPLDPERTIVRISPHGTPDHALDLEAVGRTDYATVMLAKTEAAEQVEALAPYAVVALCETARGVLALDAVAAVAGLAALLWGAEDLVASTGGTSSRDSTGTYREVVRHARARALIAAAANRVPAIDSVWLALDDLDGLRAECLDGAASGFAFKACIHPNQVEVVRDAFGPDDRRLAWARRVLEAALGESGAFRFEGQMVDGPLLAQARATLATADRLPGE